MPTNDEPSVPAREPWNWCWQCGGPLWDWSTVYAMNTFYGRVALCRTCGKSLQDAYIAGDRNGLLGYRDKETWARAKNRGKK